MTTLTAPDGVSQHALTVRFDELEFRKIRDTDVDGNYRLRGHAAVFNSLSEDLGGFREIVAPGAFRAALRGTPDVRLLVNHNPDRVLARSSAQIDGKPSLELREDATGLHVWAIVQPRSWVDDLVVEMQAGLIDQMSFAFSLRDGGDDWQVSEDDRVVRTILADGVDELHDVSVVTYPAYPASGVGIRELRHAVASGRLPASVLGEPAPIVAAPTLERAADNEPSPHDPDVVAEETTATDSFDDWRAATRAAVRAERERHLQAMKELQ